MPTGNRTRSARSTFSDAAVVAATGHGWKHWRGVLDAMRASTLPHREIAARLGREHGVAPWWRQMLTVEYERTIGRRAIGQRCDGRYGASASRTVELGVDAALAAWRRLAKRRMPFDGVEARGPPRATRTEKWRYWRLDLDDGSRVTVSVTAKGTGRSTVTADHEALASRAAADRWKAYWRVVLAEIGGRPNARTEAPAGGIRRAPR